MRSFEQINRKFRGQNAFSEVTSLAPGDLRLAKNIDIYSGEPNDYFLNRRGSAVLAPDGGLAAPGNYKNGTVFAVGDTEYRITQNGEKFYYQQVAPTVGDPTIVLSIVTVAVTDDPISGVVLKGITEANTDNFSLNASVVNDIGLYTVVLLNGATNVASGSISNATPLPATIPLTASGGSGITGTVQLDADPGTGGIPLTGTISYTTWNAGTGINDIKNANQKIFCFSQEGNSVIYWSEDEERFVARPMGIQAPSIYGLGPTLDSGGIPFGASLFYGLEKVIVKNDADIVASSPNRLLASGAIASIVSTGAGVIEIALGSTSSELSADPYWTHIRLWRSKNAVPDLSDPLFPTDAQGVPTQLYEVALITRAEIYAALAPVATGGNLPPGNSNVSAGDTGGSIAIRDGNNDSYLVRLVDLDQIDLIPIPPARTGAVHAGRIFVSGINQADIDTDLIEDVLYTTEVYSAYQEQWDPQAFLNAGRNSFKTTMLYSFNDDLLIIREGETKRLPLGNPNGEIQLVDDKIGVQTFLMAGFVTGLGIAAVCSDRYFRYLGFDYRWHSVVGKVEASNAIYPFTKQQAATAAAFGYINGKLLMLLVDLENQTDYGLFALAVKEGKGWSEYDYRVSNIVSLFNFSDGLRAAILPADSTLFEIEVDTDTDSDGEDLEPVVGVMEFAPIQAKTGMIDVSRFSFWGKLSRNASVSAKSSGVEWQTQSTYQQPGLWAAEDSLNEREYIFIPKPQTVGTFQWVPLRGQFISFTITTSGQFFMSWNRTVGVNRDVKGDLGVFQTGGIIPDGPGWNSQSALLLNFEDPGSTFYDASGNGENFAWDNTGSITNRVAQKPGKGVGVAGASIARATDPITPLLLQSNLTFKAVFSLTDAAEGSIFAYGSDGTDYWWIDAQGSSTLTFHFFKNGVGRSYEYFGPTIQGEPLVFTFVLLKNMESRMYLDTLDSFGGPRLTTVSASPPYTPPPAKSVLTGYGILSYFEVVKSAYQTEQAKRFWGTVKAY